MLCSYYSSEAKASRVIIYKFPVKLPFPVHSGLQRASTSRHIHSDGVPGWLAGIPSCAHVSTRIRAIQCVDSLVPDSLALSFARYPYDKAKLEGVWTHPSSSTSLNGSRLTVSRLVTSRRRDESIALSYGYRAKLSARESGTRLVR